MDRRNGRVASVPNLLPSHQSLANPNTTVGTGGRPSRRPSFVQAVGGVQRSPHPTLSRHATSSSVLDYRQLPYSERRIAHAKKLFAREISDGGLADFDDEAKLKPIVAEFVQAQKEKGLTQEECFDLAIELICERMSAMNKIDTFKVFTSFWKTGMSYADFITDVLVWVQLLKKWQDNVHRALAIAQGVSIGFSLLCQCVASLIMGQPLWVGLAGLIGLKPLIEGYRNAVGSKRYPNQKWSNDYML